jgi:hypothetical protein
MLVDIEGRVALDDTGCLRNDGTRVEVLQKLQIILEVRDHDAWAGLANVVCLAR